MSQNNRFLHFAARWARASLVVFVFTLLLPIPRAFANDPAEDAVEAELDSIVAQAQVIENLVPEASLAQRMPSSAPTHESMGNYGGMVVTPVSAVPLEKNRASHSPED